MTIDPEQIVSGGGDGVPVQRHRVQLLGRQWGYAVEDPGLSSWLESRSMRRTMW
ncbi:MAG: hypothetical protein ACLT9P_02500 [Evtepia gabavorous]